MLTPVTAPRDLAHTYSLLATLGPNVPGAFRRSLAGVAVGTDDAISALGDDEVRVFTAKLDVSRAWSVPGGAMCLAVDPGGTVAVGSPGRVELYDARGRHVGSFPVAHAGQPAAVTAIRIFRDEILVGDATGRCIRRYDRLGRQLGTVGDQDKTRGFMLPNRSLDFDVDSHGGVHATDTGRHRVTTWTLDGSLVAAFGRFGYANPEDFVGCCNPVNLALGPNGTVVTGEKMIARVKVYTHEGRLLAVIGPEHFDQGATHLHLAVDGRGRIVVGDPIRRELKVFAPSA